MRPAIAALVLLSSTTNAFCYGAFSVGIVKSSNGSETRSIGALARNFATKVAAIDGANQQCAMLIQSFETFAVPCRVVMIFRNQCLAVARVHTNSFVVKYQLGATEDEARANAQTVCAADNPDPACFINQTGCDGASPPIVITPPAPSKQIPIVLNESLHDHFIRSFSEQFSSVKSWWSNDVTPLELTATSTIVVLFAALVFLLRKIRKLRRLVTGTAPPSGRQSRPSLSSNLTILPTGEVLQMNAVGSPTQSVPHPAKETGPGDFDKGAVKQALKRGRQEFDI
jgi:hypothetical protein